MDRLRSDMTKLSLSTPCGGSTRSQIPSTKFETPHRQNMCSTNVFINGSLDDQRKAVDKDLGPIPEVSLAFMLQHLIPKSDVDVDATLTKLKEDGIWTELFRWKQFDGQSPHSMFATRTSRNPNNSKNPDPNTEAKIFENLKAIYDSIISRTQFHNRDTGRKPTLVFEQNPDLAPVSNTDIRSRPDGYAVLTTDQEIHTERVNALACQDDPSYNPQPAKLSGLVLRCPKPVEWLDIACVEEYKLRNGPKDRNDNVHKMIWSLHHIMNVDHRRRFCFGITVEDADFRVWLACREVVVVSQSFNFTTNPSQLIQLIASLAFAKPSELGYDPTMKLQWGENGYCYDIECCTKLLDGSVQTQTYRTQEVLSDSAYNLRGRATRVYLVRIIRPPVQKMGPVELGPYLVLKDSWIDTHRMKEGELLDNMLRGASSEEKKLFLTVSQHGVVQIEGKDDCTQDLILRGRRIVIRDKIGENIAEEVETSLDSYGDKGKQVKYIEEAAVLFSLRVPEGSTSRSASRTNIRPKPTKDSLRHNTHRIFKKTIVYSPKTHYRILFSEVGESLKEIIDDGRLTTKMLDQVMQEITKALLYMAQKGYVHRDVSIGNIIWHEGHAKLSDLDFAKEYGTEGSSFVRTGTYGFMAGEAMKGKYSVAEYIAKNTEISFVYNPVHDLESLWWVGLYSISWQYPAPFTKIIHHSQNSSVNVNSTVTPRIEYRYKDFTDQERKQFEKILEWAEEMFPSFYNWPDFESRMQEIHNPGSPTHRMQGVYPAVIHSFGRCLNLMRQCISLAYKQIQRNLPHPQASYFVDVLRVPNLSKESPSEADQLSVHDMILQIFARPTHQAYLEDAILWPIDSQPEVYREFLMRGEARERLRPRKHPHGYLNMDADEVCHED